MAQLQNRIVLITGAGGGIGWGIALECARNGARIIVTDVTRARAEAVRRILPESERHLAMKLDLRQVRQFGTIVATIERKLGPITDLVNNAGLNTAHGLLTLTEAAWDDVIDVNLKGHVFLSQVCAKRWIKRQHPGRIVFVSSVHQTVYQGRPHYVVSKAAIARLVVELAVELAPHHIRVNGIAPGGVFIAKRTEDREAASVEPTVLLGGRNSLPRDIGRMVVVLLDDHWSRQVTGEVITVSGGQYLKPSTG